MHQCILPSLFNDEQKVRLDACIKTRKSVRKYLSSPDEVQKTTLLYEAKRLSKMGVRIELCENQEKQLYRGVPFVGKITGSDTYVALIADTKEPFSTVYAGALGEAFVLEAVSLGLGTCWVQGTYHKQAVKIPLEKNEKLLAIIAVGVPLNGINKLRVRKSLESFCVNPFKDWMPWAKKVARNIRRAPSALNRQPWKMGSSGHTFQLYRAKFAGSLDMGIALFHLFLEVKQNAYMLYLQEGKVFATLYIKEQTCRYLKP